MDFNFFGLNLADTPSIKHPGLIWIIPILSCLTAYLSSYIMQKMQNMPKGNDAAANQMKMMTMLMPLMSLYFAFILRGAVGIYWIFNNVSPRTGGHSDQAHPRQAGGGTGCRSRACGGGKKGEARGKPRCAEVP